MANAFEQACGVEARSMEILRPFIEQRAFNGQYVTTNKGRLAKALQKTVGDVLMNLDDGRVSAVEMKAEERNDHGNLFLEIWSNLSRYTTGWMFNLNCDVLLYHFVECDELYVLSFPKLRHWAFRAENGSKVGHIWGFQLKRQNKYSQMNDTWGACVPIATLREQVGFRLVHPQALRRMEQAAA